MPKGVRVKVTFIEKFPPLGFLTHVDGWLRPDGLVRLEYNREARRNGDELYDYLLVHPSQLKAMAVYKQQ